MSATEEAGHRRQGIAFLLAALAAIGPFTVDTYLPSMQDIGAALRASPLQVQQTLTSYLLMFSVMSLWHGAISEFVANQNYDTPISIGAIASALLQGVPSALDLGKARRIRDTMTTLCLEEAGPDVWVKRDTRVF